ncbi:hypothetical protein O181_109677 [Austropuccinia psidii MF-1]|uniref:Uncharacterized protein n=1 Tax=Austropuccinia psidii MF-1 TaxID=1389203 RepID=A0A9Q3PRL9_9BASI|nr:hypothetical protein [Austropuccinia psidii MF-1]
MHSESLIITKQLTPIATQRSRKPQNSASIQGKPTLITFTEKITINNQVITSKGKFPKEVENKFVQDKVKGTLESPGTSQRTDKACLEPEYHKQEALDTVVVDKTLKKIIPILPLTFQFNKNLKPEDWQGMDQVLQLHQLLKNIFQWSMDKRFNLESHWAELGASGQRICLKEIPFKDLIVITKGWNPNRKFKLLEQRETRIRENQATIQVIKEKLKQTEPTMIPSGSQGLETPNSPVDSHHSGTRRSVSKSHHSSQSQVVSSKRQGL